MRGSLIHKIMAYAFFFAFKVSDFPLWSAIYYITLNKTSYYDIQIFTLF